MRITVSELQCSFTSQGGNRDQISARLRKPGGFRGSPLFADDRRVDPATDPYCQIRLDPADPTDMTYNMLVTDFGRCGVVKRNVSTSINYKYYIKSSQNRETHGFLTLKF
jgi:hypothetical protein